MLAPFRNSCFGLRLFCYYYFVFDKTVYSLDQTSSGIVSFRRNLSPVKKVGGYYWFYRNRPGDDFFDNQG
jgi:hypothetical protein